MTDRPNFDELVGGDDLSPRRPRACSGSTTC